MNKREYLTWPEALCSTEDGMSVEKATGQGPDCEERLSPPEAAEEAKRLIAAFKNILPKNRKGGCRRLYIHWPYRIELEQSPNGESLRASRQLPKIIQSVILFSEEGGGGFHFIEATRPGYYPEAYGHNSIAVRKIEEFIVGLSEAFKAS